MSDTPARTYGGQAVVEGVMMRGPNTMAVAVRTPDGNIVSHAERLDGLYTTPLRLVPLLRGIAILAESFTLGVRALSWSAAIAGETDDEGKPAELGVAGWGALFITMSAASLIFVLGPVALTFWLDSPLGSPWWSLLIEGGLRLLFLVGYVWLIGRSDDVQRVFQYHAAEHQTIHAYEHGGELSVPAIRRHPKEHPRCGTSFLLTVVIVSAIVFIFTGSDPLWWRFASRLLLIPVIAGLAYEAIRFGGLHTTWTGVRMLFTANIALQKLTTNEPDDEQIQVAIEAFQAVRALETNEAISGPPGSSPLH
jgi:uncharacterized protein YqhQ